MTDIQFPLFQRVVTILEQSRAKVGRAINTGTVTAYWLIGREIVLEIQKGEERAGYGNKVIEELSIQLNKHYGKGFSRSNLRYFRQFYLTFTDRNPQIFHPLGGKLAQKPIHHTMCGELDERKQSSLSQKDTETSQILHTLCGELEETKESLSLTKNTEAEQIGHPMCGQSQTTEGNDISSEKPVIGFHPNLGWSHYRVLMQVENLVARDFYETEAVACGWNSRELERQVHSLYYDRLLTSRDRKGMLHEARSKRGSDLNSPLAMIKDPYVLEFLDLPNQPRLYESQLESAIINNLQHFLLELGRGFAFVARQKHIRFEEEDYFIDLVFYNYLLKCFLLIDLKIGKLAYQDIGQMDGYIRIFEEQEKVAGDNPTIGLILCSHKNEAIAKYSILAESRQIFASKYKTCLPSEEELQRELQRERDRIEEQQASYGSTKTLQEVE